MAGLVLASFCISPTSAIGETIKNCPGVEVHWVSLGAAAPPYETNFPAKIATGKVGASSPDGVLSDMQEVVITGPVLGDMDSKKINVELSCKTASKLIVTATLARAATYDEGSYMHTIFWRPKIELWLTLRQPEIALEGRWDMRLTNGATVDRASTYNLPEQAYPVIVGVTLRANGITTPLP